LSSVGEHDFKKFLILFIFIIFFFEFLGIFGNFIKI